MAKVKLSLAKSTDVKQDITIEQTKEIKKIYSRSYAAIKEKIDKLDKRDNISSILQAEDLRKLNKEIGKEYRQNSKLVKAAIEKNMKKVSRAVVRDNVNFAKKVGFGIEGAFKNVPKDVVENIVTGRVYQADWTLSKALWGDDKKKLKEIDRIIAEGIAQNKSSLDIAKDLELFVNPSAKKPWDWGKVYPGSRKQIDYNAQRLARTMVNHAYQQSVIETSKDNPFVKGIQWLSAHAHGRTCELCIQRATEDQYGLGPGVFPKDKVPLDHPNGLCTLSSVIEDDFDDIADRLADWALGGEDSAIDNYANSLYGTDKFGSLTGQAKEDEKRKIMQ